MKVIELIEILDEIAPFETQEKWDNSGLIIGSINNKVNDIYLSLDISTTIINQIENNSVLITHHPLIFKSIKNIDFNTYPGNLIKLLIEKNITYICMHTNYDKSILNEYFVKSIFNPIDFTYENDFLITFNMKFKNIKKLSKFLKKKIYDSNPDILNIVSNDITKSIQKIGVCVGSGSSLLSDAKRNNVDVFLTGDISHHTAMEALENNISLIDITHYHSEKCFTDSLYFNLMNFDDLYTDILDSMSFDKNIKITCLDSSSPFRKI
jgi:dinuclear metal center YbgI/SA1388 family protein